MTVAFPSPPQKEERVLVLLCQITSFLPKDGSGDLKLVEAGHGMEVHGPVLCGRIHGRQSHSEYSIGPAEGEAVEAIASNERVWEEVRVSDSPRVVRLPAVRDEAVSETVVKDF